MAEYVSAEFCETSREGGLGAYQLVASIDDEPSVVSKTPVKLAAPVVLDPEDERFWVGHGVARIIAHPYLGPSFRPDSGRIRFLVSNFLEELVPAAAMEAEARGVRLTVMPIDDDVTIAADRQVLAAVVGNLLQNAFKFTRPRTTGTLRVGVSAERVIIEIQDECGGLPGGNAKELFRPFEQRSADRTGLGLGLAFGRWGAGTRSADGAQEMVRQLHARPAFADRFLTHMLTRNIRIEEDLIDQLFNSSEKRLARALLLLARYGEPELSHRALPKVSQELLAEMVGTTRSRVNFFMNKYAVLLSIVLTAGTS